MNWIAKHVLSSLMVLVDEGELPGQTGELAAIAQGQVEGPAENALSQLIAEAVLFMKVAAGKTSDALHLKKREDEERKDREAAHRGPQDQARASAPRRCSSAEPHRQGARTAPQSWTSYGTGTPPWHSRQRPDPPKQAKTSGDWRGHWGQR